MSPDKSTFLNSTFLTNRVCKETGISRVKLLNTVIYVTSITASQGIIISFLLFLGLHPQSYIYFGIVGIIKFLAPQKKILPTCLVCDSDWYSGNIQIQIWITIHLTILTIQMSVKLTLVDLFSDYECAIFRSEM